jgi:prepilin-type processing-associated H-X9-DG protein
VTDEDEIRGIEKGKLFPYLKDPHVYHCPADRLRKGPDGTYLYVSYAIPTCLNGAGSNNQIKKYGEITSPGTRFNFVESGERERGNWIVAGHFIMASPEYGDGGYGLWSPLAISHGNSAVFGFTDGHAEFHKWHDKAVFDHYKATEGQAPGTVYGKRMITSGTSQDFDWLVRGWAYRHKK